MNLKSMILEEMDEDEREIYFSESHLQDSSAIYSKIINPVSFNNYEELILKFLKHPNASKIAVRNSRKWNCFFREEIEENIDNIIGIAKSDRHRKKHFYLVFRMNRGRDKNLHAPCVLYFDEHKGMISVARAYVPNFFEYLFSVRKTTAFYEENKAVSPWIEKRVNRRAEFLRMFK